MERFNADSYPDEITFLMVGRIIREKGVIEYCESARELKKDYPNAHFVLLGGYDKSLGALNEEDIKPYLDDGSIEFPGESDDPVSFYRNCSVFVLPSYYREGLPRTILEAMSCSRPVITTDWPGCRDPMLDGTTGYLVPIKDKEALKEKMLEFLKNPELISIMGENAHKHCSENYDVNIINAQMKQIMRY